MPDDDLPMLEGVQYRTSVGSTMDEMRQQALAGAPEFSILLAETQTAGRGRRGKPWHSAPASGLYFTVLLRPQVALSELGLLPLLVGAAMARSIKENTGIETQLKWSNDLLTLDGRKLCGILLETKIEAGAAAFVLIGIGINVRCQEFPPELNAAALEEFAPINRKNLLKTCIENLKTAYQKFLETPEFALQSWKSHANNLGREVIILEPNGNSWTGIALDLDPSGALLVQTTSGIKTVYAAEISLRNSILGKHPLT